MPKIPLPRFPDRLSQSFIIGDASHLLRKLTSEVSAFIDNQDEIVKSGRLALNIAMTAWHMVDWTFADMDADQRVLAGRQLGRKINTQRDFAAAATEACEALRMCQVIATAGKHVEVSTRPDPSLVTRLEFFEVNADGASGQVGAMWIIERDGKKYPAEETFNQVHRFWEDLLSSLGMIEDRFMGPIDRGW